MKKKIKSAVISIVVIAVLLLAILIGVKNGTLDKLTKEMPTLATKQEETEKSTENVKNDSTESKPYTTRNIPLLNIIFPTSRFASGTL